MNWPIDFNLPRGKSLFLKAKNVQTAEADLPSHFLNISDILQLQLVSFSLKLLCNLHHVTMLNITLSRQRGPTNHITTQHDFLCRPTSSASVGCLNFFLGSSAVLLLTLFVTGVFVVGAVPCETSSVAAVSLRCVDGGVVDFGVYLAVTACEDSLTSEGETAFDSLMSFAVVKKIMITF